jgi:hypothetical protein
VQRPRPICPRPFDPRDFPHRHLDVRADTGRSAPSLPEGSPTPAGLFSRSGAPFRRVPGRVGRPHGSILGAGSKGVKRVCKLFELESKIGVTSRCCSTIPAGDAPGNPGLCLND